MRGISPNFTIVRPLILLRRLGFDGGSTAPIKGWLFIFRPPVQHFNKSRYTAIYSGLTLGEPNVRFALVSALKFDKPYFRPDVIINWEAYPQPRRTDEKSYFEDFG